MRRYAEYVHSLDVDRFEEAIGFEPMRRTQNKHGEPEDIGQCPDLWGLHKNGDTTGKFALNREKRVGNCFVCGGISLLDLWMTLKGVSEQEAQEELSEFALPQEVSDDQFLTEIDRILYEEVTSKPVMPYYNERLLEQWADLSQIDEFLGERGISPQVAEAARLGYEEEAKRIAPFKQNKPREDPYIGPCLYLPHFWGGNLVGWQQRWLSADRPKWVAKYTNTGSFPREETLYNYEYVYMETRPIIICESVMTVLFLRSIGYPAVATFGAEASAEQMRLLRRFSQGVVLAPDNDKPGRRWVSLTEDEIRHGSKRVVLAEYLSRLMPVKVIEPVGELDSGNDLGDLLSEGLEFATRAVRCLYEDAEYY